MRNHYGDLQDIDDAPELNNQTRCNINSGTKLYISAIDDPSEVRVHPTCHALLSRFGTSDQS